MTKTTLTQIKKRDGRIVPYDKNKIITAIKQAMKQVSEGTITDAEKVANKVEQKLKTKFRSGGIAGIEIIQDIIEQELILSDFAKTTKAYIIYRHEREQYRSQIKDIDPEVKALANESKKYFKNALGEFVYYRTYSRWLPEKNRRETFIETVDRYTSFMRENLNSNLTDEEYNEIKTNILNLKVVPSMRLLWSSGDAARVSNVTAYNCSFIGTTKLQDFGDIVYILSCGCGLGFTVEEHIINELPPIRKQKEELLPIYTIGDSKEGWADAVVHGMETWFSGKDVEFDFSQIRPAGARLKTMGGRSSGPDPLKDCLIFIKKKVLSRQGRRLRPIDVHDIICKIGETIVSGGVRRTALISLSDLNDNSMKFAKTGTFWQLEPQRSMSNNSAVFTEQPSAEKFLDEWISLVKSGTGERGIFNRGNLLKSLPKRRHKILKEKLDDFGTNPCLVGSTGVLLADGRKWVTIKELAEQKNDVQIYSYNPDQMKYEVKWGRNPRKTKEKAEVWKLTLNMPKTNIEGTISATTDHKFILNNMKEVELKDLKVGDKLLSYSLSDKIGYHRSMTLFQITKKEPNGFEDVYNMTVDDFHNYCVPLNFGPGSHITNHGVCVKNCGEIVLQSKQFCNLTEVIARPEDTEETLLNKIKIATILGTYQATLTNFPYIAKDWTRNCQEEALLGVSITGFWDCEVARNPDVLIRLKQKAIETNKIYAEKFGINQSTCITTAKPSGNVSQLVDSSSGVHPRYAKYYIRRVRINATDPLFKMLKDQKIPYHPEIGQVDGLASTYVLEFPIKSPDGATTRHDLTALQQLEFWKMVKTSYTEHNPSVTIYVDEHEWIDVANYVYKNWDIIGGLSFLPKDKHVYTLAPYEEITEEKYKQLVAEFPEIDCSKILAYEKEDETEGAREIACTGDKCELR